MTSLDALQLIAALLEHIESRRVRFIHWKSNEHLDAALRGETDLDLLVDPDDKGVFEEIMDELGFLPMEPPRERRLPGIESFLGFDAESGRLVHLDVHYRVVLGEQLLKNHHLPVEDWLLSDASRLQGVAVPAPERELLILFLRSALKTKSRQIVRARLKGGSPFPDNIRREARWLAELSNRSKLTEVASSSGLGVKGSDLTEFMDRALEDRFEWKYVLRIKRDVLSRLRRFERMPWYAALLRRVWLRLRNGDVMKRLGLGLPRRHLPFPTPLIAAIGADGSGKTRLTRDLEVWLGSKLVVRHVYFGQPKSGLVFKLLNKPGSIQRNRSGSIDVEGFARFTEAVKWVWLAIVRRRLARSARSAARRGTVVIAERYPLSDFFSMETPMDGPRLQPEGPLATFEMSHYESIASPDLTLVLDTSLETLRARKEDLSLEEHVPKVDAVKALDDSPGRVRIDVSLPYEEVLDTAKKMIWEALRASR